MHRRSTQPLVAFALLALAACISGVPPGGPLVSSPDAQARQRIASIAAAGTPSLEEIFLLPGPEGVAPQLDSLSADGLWALVRWSPLLHDERGSRSLSSEDGLRLVCLAASSSGEAGLGTRLETLLPPPAPDAADDARLRTTWSEAGAQLAVQRGRELYLLDLADLASEPVAHLLYADVDPAPASERRAEGAEGAEGADDKAPRARPTQLGANARVSFLAGDRRLRITTRAEVLEVDLGSDTEFLGGARWISEAVLDDAAGAQWSDDDSVVFRAARAVAHVTAAPDDPLADVQVEVPVELPVAEPAAALDETLEELPAEPPAAEATEPLLLDAQVLHMGDARAVVLEGFADLKGRESERLAPDGKWVFAFELQRTDRPEPNLVPDFLSERVSTSNSRRERADDQPPGRRVWMWDTNLGTRARLEWEEREGASIWPLGWAPQPRAADGSLPPARFALARTSADYRERELWCFEAGTWRRLSVERDTYWLGGPAGNPRWSLDGASLLVPSETLAASSTPGRCQLFRIDAVSGHVQQLTRVAGELDEFSQRADGGLVLTASQSDPARRELLYLAPGALEAVTLPTPEGFLERPRSAGSRVIFAHSTLGQPAELWTLDLDAPAAVVLSDTTPHEFSATELILPDRLEVQGANGARVASHVFLPRGTSLARPDRARACVVFVHGAGYLQNVTDSLSEYPVNFMFHSRLAQMGYVVLDTDYRGSKGYGARFRGEVQFHLGGLDLDDLARSVDDLVARGVVDPERVGLYGGSYGGFLTLMALFTQPERWACGAALRSVTDWRSYHPGYTVPRLGRPSTHAEAYTLSSPIDHASGLRAPLLLLHGMRDSNVFAQDSIRLMEALIDQGKSFEAMLYPSQNHAFEDGMHWLDEYGRIEAFMLGNLGAP